MKNLIPTTTGGNAPEIPDWEKRQISKMLKIAQRKTRRFLTQFPKKVQSLISQELYSTTTKITLFQWALHHPYTKLGKYIFLLSSGNHKPTRAVVVEEEKPGEYIVFSFTEFESFQDLAAHFGF